VLAREVLHGLQPLERNETKSIQVASNPGGREIVSSCAQIKFFTRTYETFIKTSREMKALDSGRTFSKKEGMMWMAYGPNGG